MKQVRCTLTKHRVPEKDEDRLFEGTTLTVETECERCHTPLILERTLAEKDQYYITEYVEVEED